MWTLPAAAIVCFVFGFLFGLPALRLEGIYLALATFALAIAMPQVLKSSVVEHWTGGVQGIVIIKPDAPFGLPLNSDQWLYVFTVAVAIVMYVCAANLVKSRTGRALIAIRDHPIAASAMGINVSLYKSLTFGVSALYTGVAGALGAIAIAFVAPDSFTFVLAVALFVGLVVGGVGSIPGTIVGGFFVLFVPNIAESDLEGTGRRGLRRHPDGGHLPDADRRGRPGATGHRQDWCDKAASRRRHDRKGGSHADVEACADCVDSRRVCAGRSRRRAEEIRSRRERHRDQDRQHHAVQRARPRPTARSARRRPPTST